MARTATQPLTLEDRLAQLTREQLLLLRWHRKWTLKARAKQLPPDDGDWLIYGLRAGRGFGKTEAGSNWLALQAAYDPGSINFVIAPTHDDLKTVCFGGPTGFHACIPQELVAAEDKGLPSLTLWNGSFIRGFASESPNRLRGPQCARGWCDEIAAWRNPQEVWDNYEFGLRLGARPRTIWTSTLKPTPFIRKLLQLPHSMVVAGSTYENRENLPKSYFERLQKYEGTAIGRQELYGELLDPEDSGFIRRSQWKLWPAKDALPVFKFVVMSLDTAFTEKTFDKKEQQGDPTGCSVWGVFEIDRKAQVMLLDCWEDYLGLPALITRVKKERKNAYGSPDLGLADEHGPLFGRPLVGKLQQGTGHTCDAVLIEEKGSGISLRQVLANEDVLTVPYNPGKMDKLSRLHAVSPMFASGRVWAVESNQRAGEFRSWADPLISQVCTYGGEG
ncbi:MAG TPA: terminase family protein, partial [Thermoanaerobaculia bacterium]|nr:terminase family protein [Thermoanaerobaculia bacterium]